MNSVENVTYQDFKCRKIHFNTKERKSINPIAAEYEPELIKKIESEIYKLSVEPGSFDFEYDDEKAYYEVCGNNFNQRDLTEVKIIDVTDKHRLKRKINNYDSLVLLGEMSAGFIHDIGNQLMVMLSASELLEKSYDKKALELLKKTSKNSSELVQNLLSYIRHETTVKTVVNLSDLIKEAVKLFKHLNSKEIIIKTSGLDDDLYVLAERKAILNVILNILINARDAISHSGEIYIEVKLVNLTYLPENSAFYTTPKGSYYKISITDNGKGILDEDIDKIFIPFYTTKKNRGTGLGLANSAMIIEENKGVLSVKTKVNYGTTFDIYLKSINAYQNPNVLVVSDNILFLTNAKKILNKYNYNFYFYAKTIGQLFYEENFPEISFIITDESFACLDDVPILIVNQDNLEEKVRKFL